MPVLAIDFGTTTTVAAVRSDDGRIRLVTVEGTPLMPSAVYLGDNGVLLVGRDAERQARLDPARFEPNPKRRIDDGEILLGPAALPVAEVIAAVLRRAADEAARDLGTAPTTVLLTHPARWGAGRRATLLDAARRARLGPDVRLVPEPIAAASQFADRGGTRFPVGTGVAVYDLGGGTFDAAVVRRGSAGWEVAAEAGFPDLGGVDFDQALLDLVGRTEGSKDPAAWRAVVDPATPSGPAARRARRALGADITDAKEALSRWPQTQLPMPAPFADLTITRAEFEALIRPDLRRTVELLADQLAAARGPAGSVAGVYLVGGSSRIPLVGALIRELLGVAPITLDQPETAAALGGLTLAAAAAGRPSGAVGSVGSVGPVGSAGPIPPPSGRQPVARPSGFQPGQPGQPARSSQPVRSNQPVRSSQAGPGQPPRQPPPGRPPTGGPGQPPERPTGWWSRGRIIAVAAAAAVLIAGGATAAALSQVGSSASPKPDPTSASSDSPTTAPPTTVASTAASSRPPDSPSHPSSTVPSSTVSTKSSTTGPTTTAPSAPSSAAGAYDKYFPDPDVRSYMGAISKHILACQAYDPKFTSTQCTLDTGLLVEISGGTKRTATGRTNPKAVGTGGDTWKESRWVAGAGQGRLRSWLKNGKATSPRLYWDRNGTVNGILLAPGSATTTTAAALIQTWKDYFRR